VSHPEIMQRDLQSRSREIMDSVEHGQSFNVTRGRPPRRGTDPAAPLPARPPGEEFTAMSRNGRP